VHLAIFKNRTVKVRGFPRLVVEPKAKG